MYVNLNPIINKSRPSFKASFSNDSQTSGAMFHVCSGPGRIEEKTYCLAAHYALKDIKSNDKIGLFFNYGDDNEYYVRNLTNGEMKCFAYGRLDKEGMLRLLKIITEGKFIKKKPKLSAEEYIQQARDFYETTVKKEKDLRDKLEQQIDATRKKLYKLEEKFDKVEYVPDEKFGRAIQREIYAS